MLSCLCSSPTHFLSQREPLLNFVFIIPPNVFIFTVCIPSQYRYFACLYIWIVYSHIHINNSFFFTWVTICYTILCHQGLLMLTDILQVHSSQLIIVSPWINILHIHCDGYSGGCPYFTTRGTLLWIFCDKLPCTHMCKFLQGMCLIGKLLHPKVNAFRLVLCTIKLIFRSHRREEMTSVSFISYLQ